MKAAAFLFLLVIVTGCAGIFKEKSSRSFSSELSHPRLIEGELRLVIKNIHRLNGDSLRQSNLQHHIPQNQPPTLLLWSSQIRSFPNQQSVKMYSVTPPFTEKFTESENKNTILFWNLQSGITENDSITIQRHFSYICYDYQPQVAADSATWDWGKIPKHIQAFYTKNEPYP